MSEEKKENTRNFNRKAGKIFADMLMIYSPIDDSLLVSEFNQLLESTLKIPEDDYDAITKVFERMTFLRKEILEEIDNYRSSNEFRKSEKSQQEKVDSSFQQIRDAVESFIQILDQQTEKLEKEGKHVREEDYMKPMKLKAKLEYKTPMLANDYRHLIEDASKFLEDHKDISTLKLPSLSKAKREVQKFLEKLNTNVDHLTIGQKDTHDELQRGLENLLLKIQAEVGELLVRQKSEKRVTQALAPAVSLKINFDSKETLPQSDIIISSFSDISQLDPEIQKELLQDLHKQNAFGLTKMVQETLNNALLSTSDLRERRQTELSKLHKYLLQVRDKIKIWDNLLLSNASLLDVNLERERYIAEETDIQMLQLYRRYITYTPARANAFKALLNYEIDKIELEKDKKIHATAKAVVGYTPPLHETLVKEAKSKIFDPEVNDLLFDFEPKSESPNNLKLSRKIAEKIGIHARISKLKRKIYLAQLFGARKGVDKFKPKLEAYITLLENEKRSIENGMYSQSNKDILSSVFKNEIAYCKNLMREFSKDLNLNRRARRAAKLAGKNTTKKATELFQNAIEKLEIDSKELHNKLYNATSVKAPSSKTMSAEDFLAIIKSKMEALKNEHPELYHDYLLGLFCIYKKQYQHLSQEEKNLVQRQPELAAEIIQKFNLRGLAVNSNTIETAKALHTLMFESEDFERLRTDLAGTTLPPVLLGMEVTVDPVFNILDKIDVNKLDLSVREPIDIISDTSTDQQQKTDEFGTLILSNYMLHKDAIKHHLDEYMRLQLQHEKALPLQKQVLEKKLAKIEKSLTTLLGLRQLNETLKSQILYNIAMNDTQNLEKLGDLSTGFAITISTALNHVKFEDPHTTKLLQNFLKNEAKLADEYSSLALERQAGGKLVSAKRAGASLIKQWAVKKIRKEDEDKSPPSTPAAAA